MGVKRFLVSLTTFIICLLTYLTAPRALSIWKKAEKKASAGEKPAYYLTPILCFHNLDGKGVYSITSAKFRRYMRLIRDHGVQVVPLRTLYRHALEKRLFRRPSLVITIDDDYKNIVRVAAPILREFNYPASFFVYTQKINAGPRAGLSWEDLRRLRREGFEIQNHSHTHTAFHFPRAGEKMADYRRRVRVEIIHSREILEKRLPGLKIYAFAYPMGYYSNYLKKKLKYAGYELLLTTDAVPWNLTKKFKGTMDRFTVQKKKYVHNPERLFLRQLKYAKRKYNPDEKSDISRPVF